MFLMTCKSDEMGAELIVIFGSNCTAENAYSVQATYRLLMYELECDIFLKTYCAVLAKPHGKARQE